MNPITLTPLTEAHFPLLLQWLNAPHVHRWWNPEITWTLEKITEKYTSYTQGYKVVAGEKKPIHAYIIDVYDKPIGYFQVYNAYDFERIPALSNLPESLGAFDIFIGNHNYLHQGIGSATLLLGLEQVADTYTHILADTHIENNAARRTYEKAGFKIIEVDEITDNIRMLKTL